MFDPAQTAFVFVTPRRWADKDGWATERQAEGHWREVRVYDADDLETWLETVPAVHIWLSIRLERHSPEAHDIEGVWDDWSQATDPALTKEFILAGRKPLTDKAMEWLIKSSEATFALQASSQAEALAILAAILLNQPAGLERDRVVARTLVVDSLTAWNVLTLSDAPLILIPRFDEDYAAIGRARRNGHRVVVLLGAADSSGTAEEAPRLGRREAENALRAMGIAEKKVAKLADLARHSMTCFRREIAVRPEIRQPPWHIPRRSVLFSPRC